MQVEKPALELDWAKCAGLVPAIIQHADRGGVLMLGCMSPEALAETLRSRRVTFYSRSRRRLWTKGETSGNWLELVSLGADCDGDAILVQARPRGPTCHLGRDSCFGGAGPAGHVLAQLDAVIAMRQQGPAEDSYTRTLLAAGPQRIAQKIGEEGVETALAMVAEDDAAVLAEAADLVYHLLVGLRARGLDLAALEATLADRFSERPLQKE